MWPTILQVLIYIIFFIYAIIFICKGIKFISHRKTNTVRDFIRVFRYCLIFVFSLTLVTISEFTITFFETGETSILPLISALISRLWMVPLPLILMKLRINKAKDEDELALNQTEQGINDKYMKFLPIIIGAGALIGIIAYVCLLRNV